MLHDTRHHNSLRRAATRRDFVKSLAAAATATLGLPEPRANGSTAGSEIVHPSARADAIIVLWLAAWPHRTISIRKNTSHLSPGWRCQM